MAFPNYLLANPTGFLMESIEMFVVFLGIDWLNKMLDQSVIVRYLPSYLAPHLEAITNAVGDTLKFGIIRFY